MQSLALLKPIQSILWSVALLLLGNGLISTLLTLRGTNEGFSSATMGLIMSSYFIGFVCGTWVSGRLIRRMGHIRTFAFCASICASATLLHIIFIDAWVWIVLRFFYGLAYITLMTVIESWLNSQAASHERGRIFAFYMVVNLGALTIAQQMLHIATPDNFLLFAIVSILISWAILPLTLTRRNQPMINSERPKSSLKNLLKIAPLSVAGSTLSGLAMGAFWAMTPIYATELGYDISGIALIMSLTILGGAALQIPIGRYSDKHDRPKVITWVVALAGIIALSMAVIPSQTALLAIFFIWGGLSFSIYPLSVAQLIDQLHPDEIVSGSSDMLVLHGLGCAFAPVIAGSLMTIIGSQGLPLYIGTVLLILAGYTAYRRRRVVDLVSGDNAHFEPMVQTSSQVLSMMFDQPQRDLFDDPSFYEEEERNRIINALRQSGS
ncbi:MAG: MFS transporter [Pseudomonadota bacterium]|uniref:MFS transporter n=1 Tax=Methylophaga thalassica TaxID=40223 RepID=A0ABQ5TTI1_9GAMM|nr:MULTISPECIES: MFS transporter [Methylophaga]MEC9412487.1 MFS transporter [Pseudomonadota bacterium]WVI86450.1 MFS transporter [Methylophaga thalassica]GLP98712.1 MFS transporter [Methylophaga thalassica]HIC47534.1 MFS transporter [Methylophaga sp.]HIM40552.1 MFS transporter [Methylophaga aminisulfidivorans]